MRGTRVVCHTSTTTLQRCSYLFVSGSTALLRPCGTRVQATGCRIVVCVVCAFIDASTAMLLPPPPLPCRSHATRRHAPYTQPGRA